MGKRGLSEKDIKARYITPAITDAGWDIKKQVRLEYAFTAGRIILRGNITARGKKKRADYVLFYKNNFSLAVIEAKDNNHSVGAGLQQAIDYVKTLDIYYVYTSNGDSFVEQNLITGEVRELRLNEFPSPEDLYQRCLIDKNINEVEEKVLLEPYYYVPNYKTPRYYQRVAIYRTVDAVAKGQERDYHVLDLSLKVSLKAFLERLSVMVILPMTKLKVSLSQIVSRTIVATG